MYFLYGDVPKSLTHLLFVMSRERIPEVGDVDKWKNFVYLNAKMSPIFVFSLSEGKKLYGML